ncbi:MAG: septation protein IspZ [Alphaproteobacteria bacterium]|nr:septation protein IspZ [Alphaproteobacteria bacterium]
MSPQLRRTVIDFGPLLSFFVAYKIAGLNAATATIMIVAVLAACAGYWFDRRLHPLPVATAVVVLVLGGLTLYLNDPTFIKMKPTMVYGLLGGALLGGMLLKQPLIKHLFGDAVALSDGNWKALTWRFVGFFLAMAVLNELIWRNFSNEIWVDFHVFGAIALTVLFSISQVPFLLARQIEDQVPDGDGS